METGRITLEGAGRDLRERPEVQAAYLGMGGTPGPGSAL
jgi:ABC-type branched-subunit amino acid transport system ATPase component